MIQGKIHNYREVDPTRTLSIRRGLVNELNGRFAALVTAINKSVIENDCFGLSSSKEKSIGALFSNNARAKRIEPIRPKQYAFNRSEDKVKEFLNWLKRAEKQGILELITNPRPGAAEQAWINIYIQRAYKQGIKNAKDFMDKEGVTEKFAGVTPEQRIGMAFEQPFHADRVGLIYTRTYNELKGVTNDMEKTITRILSEGMVAGDDGRSRWIIVAAQVRPVTGDDIDHGAHGNTIRVNRAIHPEHGIEGQSDREILLHKIHGQGAHRAREVVDVRDFFVGAGIRLAVRSIR